MSSNHILIVEDEVKIARLLADYLEQDGYQVSVLNEGTNAVETVSAGGIDFIILDLMLPGKDGLTICREVRKFSEIPILMLTARVDEIDRLLGLELGADDYVCKPFSPREVVARVRAIGRRLEQPPATSSAVLVYLGLVLDTEKHLCHLNEVSIDLTPVEYRLLAGLMAKPGRVYSRDQLMDISYPDGRVVSDRTIDTHVKNLRKKLAQENEEELIHSIYGVGYKIE